MPMSLSPFARSLLVTGAYRLEYTGTALCMPALDPTVELFTRVVDAIVVALVMQRSCQAVAEHAFRERREGVDRILVQEPCRGRIVAFSCREGLFCRGSKLGEFIFRCESMVSAIDHHVRSRCIAR